jgi:hypothetical protein
LAIGLGPLCKFDQSNGLPTPFDDRTKGQVVQELLGSMVNGALVFDAYGRKNHNETI